MIHSRSKCGTGVCAWPSSDPVRIGVPSLVGARLKEARSETHERGGSEAGGLKPEIPSGFNRLQSTGKGTYVTSDFNHTHTVKPDVWAYYVRTSESPQTSWNASLRISTANTMIIFQTVN